jgi:hypothetical protein
MYWCGLQAHHVGIVDQSLDQILEKIAGPHETDTKSVIEGQLIRMYETLTRLPSSQSSLTAFSHRHRQRCHSEPRTEGIPTPCRLQGRRCFFSGLVTEIHFFYVDHSNGSQTQCFICYTMTMPRTRDSYSKHCSKLEKNTEKRRGAKC